MQTDYLGRVSVVEMAIHSVADLLTKGVQRVCLSKNRLAQSPRSKTAFRRFLDHKNDFIHGFGPKTCLQSFRDSAFIGKNALSNQLRKGAWLQRSFTLSTINHLCLLRHPAAREWSCRDASDIDGQAGAPNERDAHESKLSEFLIHTSSFSSQPIDLRLVTY